MEERLSKKERQERILAQLRSNVAVRISSLADEFAVSTETIRRDIDQLTEKGFVNRTYGGASALPLAAEPGFLQRGHKNIPERKQIASYAVSLVGTDDVLMIDSGSTTTHFAHALASQSMKLTVLTNCIPVANALASTPGFRVILCPGDYNSYEYGVYGHETTDFLKRFRANKVFLGAGGLNATHVSDPDSRACWLKRAMIAQAERAILLIDGSKFGVQLFERVCSLDDIDDLVTDAQPPKEIRQALGTADVRLHLAP